MNIQNILTRRNFLVSIFLFLLCLLTYSNSLRNNFLMDDYAMIVQNRAIHDSSFLQLIPEESNAANIAPAVYWRPVAHLSIMFSFLIFNLNPLGYHILNLLLFYLACVALYELLDFIFGNRQLAFFTAVLFGTHPINGMLVNYSNATGYAVLIFALLFSMRCFLLAEQGGGWRKYILYGLSLFWFFTALLCHETSFAGPFYLAAILFLVKQYSWRRTLTAIAPMIAVLMIYFFLRQQFVSLQTGTLDKISAFNMSPGEYGAGFSSLVLFFLKNLIFLKDIVLIWSAPLAADNLFLSNAALGILFIICCLMIIHYGKGTPQSLGLSWFLIGLIPLGLAAFSRPNLGFIIQSHWMFFSSMGFFIFIAGMLIKLKAKLKRWLWFFAVGIIISSYIFNTWSYNRLWGNEIAYCRYMLKLSPDMDLPRRWLASAYQRTGDYEQSRALFNKVLTGGFQDWDVYVNLGIIESTLGNREAALNYFHKAIQFNPYAAEAFNNIGAEFLKSNELDSAQKYLVQAIQLDPYFIDPKKNLATLYLAQGKTREAVRILEEVLQIQPFDQHSLRTLKRIK